MARYHDREAKLRNADSNFDDMSLFTEDMSKPGYMPMGDYVKIVKDPSSGINETYKSGIGVYDKKMSRDTSFVKKHIGADKE